MERRRTEGSQEGRSALLKRFIAREVYNALKEDLL